MSDVRYPPVPELGDETAELLQALKTMTAGLATLVGTVRQASDSIATGCGEIANGNADLSQRTEEQASNLQQTAASLEQLSGAVTSNADTAREATRLAAGASAVAARGGEVVGQVVSTMQEISTSSRRIGDIIGVIDGIAFQTNIHEQTRGLDQVNSAVSQLDDVTQQNAALVEQAAAAAGSLDEQARRLVQAVSVFRLQPAAG